MRLFKKIVSTVICLCLIAVSLGIFVPENSLNVSAATSSELQNKINSLNEKQKKIQKKLDSLKDDKADAKEKAENLQDQVDVIETKVDTMTAKVNALGSEIENLTIVPNPTDGLFRVSVTGSMAGGRIELLSQAGKMIRIVDVESYDATIDISDLPSGIYVLRLVTDTKVLQQKVVKY